MHPEAPARLLAALHPRGVGARSSTDRAFDYGSKGWEFESLRARQAWLMNHPARSRVLIR